MAITPRIILFMGPEGAGKTTHGKRLAEEIGKPYITTSAIIRHYAEHDTGPLGEECREMFATNTYLSGGSLLLLLAERFKEPDVRQGFILDGGMRTLPETIGFSQVQSDANLFIPVAVMYLQISKEVALDRLVTGINARKRSDDTIEGVTSRLNRYYFQLEERLAVIKSNPLWTLFDIDAEQTMENVYAQIQTALAGK